jgi:hypothetical protein
LNDPTNKLLAALREHGYEPRPSGDGWTCRCPAHDDRNPSLSINVGDDGRVLLRCHRGCSIEEIVGSVGMTLADLFVPDPTRQNGRHKAKARTTSPAKPSTPSRTWASAGDAVKAFEAHRGPKAGWWPYHNREGERIGVVVRWNHAPDPANPDAKPGKTVLPFSRQPDGRWACEKIPNPHPLYDLHLLAKAPKCATVYIAEGEKTCEAAKACGLLATTSAGGEGRAKGTDWTPLAGHPVVIVPDHDDAGEGYGADVARLALAAGAASVKIIQLWERWPDLPERGDLADLAAGLDADGLAALGREVEALVATAEPVVPDSIRAPKGASLRESNWTPIPITELGPSTPPAWVWTGYVAKGHTTLLTGVWKGGKSTLIGHLLHDLTAGGGLVPEPLGGKVLVVTEEGHTLWCRRRDDLDLGEDVHILSRPFKARASMVQWLKLTDHIAAMVASEGYSLVVLDTLPNMWPVVQENDASEVGAALMPLHAITEAGAGLLLIHHPRKSGGAEGEASRGSGALPGHVDIIVEMRRFAPEDKHDRRRVLATYSRFDESPPESVLELTSDAGYRVVGDKAHVKAADRMDLIAEALPCEAPGVTVVELRSRWPSNPPPGKRTLETDLQTGATEGRWIASGKGKKGDPVRYRRAPQFDSRRPPALGARIESEPVASGSAADWKDLKMPP